MRKIFFVFIVSLFASNIAFGQSVAFNTNLLYLCTTTPNVGVEAKLAKKVTFDVNAGHNMWRFSSDKRLNHWLVQPELRYWFCEAFNGHFLGIHAHGGQFDIGGVNIPIGRAVAFKDKRFTGDFIGAGLSYGYQWILCKHWNFEASIGGGYARINYIKSACPDCSPKESEGFYNYWGITRSTLSLIYIF